MKILLSALLLFFLPKTGLASSCCIGGGPKSFIQLRELQNYQLGVSTSIRDVYGRYDAYGDLIKADKNQTYNVSLGAGARLFEDLYAFTILPWVHQVKEFGQVSQSGSNLGDILLGARMRLVRSLFHDEWYPTITVSGGVKFPTGTVEQISSEGRLQPGTGNGRWEPFVGIGLQKDYGFVILALNTSYTYRSRRSVPNPNGSGTLSVKEGDRVELSETGTLPLSRRLSVSLGSQQTWEFSRDIDRQMIADSQARFISANVSSSYFLSQFWSMAAGAEFTLPIARSGVNSQAARAVTFTSTYTFY